jgi:hypothetical protein
VFEYLWYAGRDALVNKTKILISEFTLSYPENARGINTVEEGKVEQAWEHVLQIYAFTLDLFPELM